MTKKTSSGKNFPEPDPRFYNYNTNSVNDYFSEHKKNFLESIAEDLREKFKSWESLPLANKENLAYKAFESTLAAISRNRLNNIRRGLWFERNEDIIKNYGLVPGTEVEPCLVTDVYESILAWLQYQNKIFGCIYDLSDLLVLKAVLDVDCVDLIIDARSWLKKNDKYRADRVEYFDEIASKKGSSIKIFDHPENAAGKQFNSMHQKWLVGENASWAEQKEHDGVSMYYGSYNLSNNAKRNIESCLYFPTMSHNFYLQFFADHLHLKLNEKHVYDWPDFKSKNNI